MMQVVIWIPIEFKRPLRKLRPVRAFQFGPNRGFNRARGTGFTPVRALAFVLPGLVALVAGCPATQSLPTQAAVLERTEASTASDYLLYVPSTYQEKRALPLVVACHGTFPWDGAAAQMREWAKFAEYEGIIVVAPQLESARGDFPPPPPEQKARQEADERRILAVVDEVKRRYRVAEHQIFLTGWSAGAFPILHTGLRHPDVFRAIYIRQGTFNPDFLDIPDDRRHPWQRIHLVYGKTDALRDQSIAAKRWLEEAGYFVTGREMTGAHQRTDPHDAWRFFQEVSRKHPWIRIRGEKLAADSLRLQFQLDAVPDALEQKWFFGDGGESYERSPVHEYAEPGKYDVTVNVMLKGGQKFRRARTFRVFRTLAID